MTTNSKIEWTDHTFNPWWGCSKVHEGCTHCYAEAFSKRTGRAKWGDAGTRVMTSPSNWREPVKWNRAAEAAGKRARVFCASMADVFEDWRGDILNHKGERAYSYIDHNASAIDGSIAATMNDARRDLFRLIDSTPWLDWLLLTKRPENIRRMWQQPMTPLNEATWPGKGRRNVWLGTSVSSQESMGGIEPLLACRDLAPVLFLSCEPLLGPIGLTGQLAFTDGLGTEPGIDWVIVGGESGAGSRPCNLNWIREIVAECGRSNAACFVKQLGSSPVFSDPMKTAHWPKSNKGGDPDEWPADLRVRQMPDARPLAMESPDA